MASFYGTAEEFDRFLMPRIRNRIQFLTRPLKERANGACELCGRRGGTLEAAHVHGRDRKTIVRGALEKYRSGEGYHIGDLDAFEREVVEAHEPVEETFLFLCRDCHREYDAQQHAPGENPAAGRDAQPAPEGLPAKSQARMAKLPASSLPEEFYAYLVDSGYTEYTKSGNPGTVYSYKNAVDKVCAWEGCGWDELAERVDDAIRQYSPGGVKASLGRQSHNTVINGLRAYGRFCATRKYRQEPRAADQPKSADVPVPGARAAVNHGGALPIKLIPGSQDAFKRAFLDSGKAEIREYYADGSVKSKTWIKRPSGGFSMTSNVIGNLRSRPEYRSGVWQESGIVRIEVEVVR